MKTVVPTMILTQPEPLPTPVLDTQTPIPNAAATLSELMPTEYLLTGNSIMNEILVSFSQGLHSGKMQCEQCHIVEAGLITRKLVWVDENAGLIENITEPQQICLKCHDYLSMASTVMLQHLGFECTYCHDPHHPQPTCAQSACH